MKPIVRFYKNFATDIGITIDDDGAFYVLGSKPGTHKRMATGILVGEKRKTLPIYLPDDKNLEREEDGTRVMFHPACESVMRGQSEILNRTIHLTNLNMFRTVIGTMDSLLRLSANTDLHSKLSLPLMEVISELPVVSKTTVNHWANLCKVIKASGKHSVFSLKIYREKEIAGVKYSRVCKIRSPLMASEDLFGVPMSQTAQAVIRKAFELVAGDVDMIQGSNSPTAPTFIALATVYNDFMTNVSRIDNCLGKYNTTNVNYSGKWAKSLNKLHDWYTNDLYIQLLGNIGIGEPKQEHIAVDEPEQVETLSNISGKIVLDESDELVTSAPVEMVAEKEATKDGIPVFKVPTIVTPSAAPYGVPQNQYPVQQQPVYPSLYGNQMQQQAPQAHMAQPAGQMFYDSRTGKYRPSGGGSQQVAPQVQQQVPVSFPEVPGYKGPIPDNMGSCYYTSLNTGASVGGIELMASLRNSHNPMGGIPQQPQTLVSYDTLGNPIYG